MSDQKSLLADFRKNKVLAREELSTKAVSLLKELSPIAIHQFGSGGRKEQDEFSDTDLFVTVADSDFEQIVQQRLSTYKSIAPIILRLFQTEPNKAGWFHDLIIFEHKKSLVHFDLYITPQSKVVLPPHSILIFGEDDLNRNGEWSVQGADHSGHDLVDGILAMSFIGIKGVIRKWDSGFFEWLTALYDSYVRDFNPELDKLPKAYDFSFFEAILKNMRNEGNAHQKMANKKIHAYLDEVRSLY